MSTYARVKLTIDVAARSSWPDNVTMDQVVKQAGEETLRAIKNLMFEDNRDMKIIGTPEVTAVFHTPKQGK